jgi:hypothetical protein
VGNFIITLRSALTLQPPCASHARAERSFPEYPLLAALTVANAARSLTIVAANRVKGPPNHIPAIHRPTRHAFFVLSLEGKLLRESTTGAANDEADDEVRHGAVV